MLDEIDKKILHTLVCDGRASVETVAAEIGLSPTPVRRRIRRLEADGVIKGYRAEIDLEKCGLELSVFVFLKLQSRDQQTIRAFERQVLLQPEIESCALITGPHDYLLTLHTADMKSYHTFLHVVLAALPGIAGIETSMVIGDVKTRSGLPFA